MSDPNTPHKPLAKRYTVAWQTKHSANGSPFRVGVCPELGSTVLVVLRDLAAVFEYAEARVNAMAIERLQLTTINTVCATTGRNARAIALPDVERLKIAVQDYKSWYQMQPEGQKRSKGARLPMAYVRVGPFTLNGQTVEAFDVPSVTGSDGKFYIRVADLAKAAGLAQETAWARVRVVLKLMAKIGKGTTNPPKHKQLIYGMRQLVFGQDYADGRPGGRPTNCWPVEQAELLWDAITIARPPRRPFANDEVGYEVHPLCMTAQENGSALLPAKPEPVAPLQS